MTALDEFTNKLEEVGKEICDKCCKHMQQWKDEGETDEGLDRLSEEICPKCPLMELY